MANQLVIADYQPRACAISPSYLCYLPDPSRFREDGFRIVIPAVCMCPLITRTLLIQMDRAAENFIVLYFNIEVETREVGTLNATNKTLLPFLIDIGGISCAAQRHGSYLIMFLYKDVHR